ncbi:MAG: glycosyltransferase family 4 protein [Candidatus Helarchaeota archaeon]
MKIKVLIIGSGVLPIPPKYGGAIERHIYELAVEFSKLNIDVHVISINKYKMKGINIHKIKIPKLPKRLYFIGNQLIFLFFGFLYIIHLNKKIQFDIIHLHTGIPSLMAYFFHFFFKKKIIFTAHNPYPRLPRPNQILKLITHTIETNLEILTAKISSKVICVNKIIKFNLINNYNINKSKIFIIPNGVNPNKFRPKPPNKELLKKLRMINKKVILYVGRITPDKGINYLINSIPTIIKNIPNCEFIFIGPKETFNVKRNSKKNNIPTFYSMILKKINDLNINKYVKFLENISTDVLIDFFNLADIFVLPSISEGLPLSLLEALSCGKPIITTNIQGNSEIKDIEKAGILIPPKNEDMIASAIIKLLSNDKIRFEMGKNARKIIINNYSWKNIAKKTKRIYLNLK